MKMDANQRKIKIAAVCCVLIASAALLDTSENRKRKWWVKPWLQQERGNVSLVDDFMAVDDAKSYKNFLRMNENTFQKLLSKISHKISKQSIYRECISARDKLIITLRYLATGETFRSLMYNYRIHESTISLFVPVVCKAIYEELKAEYLKVPSTAAEWLEIAREFEIQWHAPNVIGALDGKHICISAQGAEFHNYKGTNSIVLLALVDANYNFTYINVGTNGRVSDGGVYWNSDLSNAIEQNLLSIPEDKPLPGRTKPMPHVIVADAAFSQQYHIMKPYPYRGMTNEQRIFNYRLSRARRVVENAFGILANRFRVLLHTIPLKAEKARIITQACCTLHNFLKKESIQTYLGTNPETDIDRRYRFVYGLSKQQSKRPTNNVLRIRDEFKEYFNGCGSVPWQNDII